MRDEDDELNGVDDEETSTGFCRYHCVECKKSTVKPQYGPPAADWLVRCPACYQKLTGVLTMTYVPRRPPDKRTRAEAAAESIKQHLKPVEGDRRAVTWAQHVAGPPRSYAAFLKAYYKKAAWPAKEAAITCNVNPHDHWPK